MATTRMKRDNFRSLLRIPEEDLVKLHHTILGSLEDRGYDVKTCTSSLPLNCSVDDVLRVHKQAIVDERRRKTAAKNRSKKRSNKSSSSSAPASPVPEKRKTKKEHKIDTEGFKIPEIPSSKVHDNKVPDGKVPDGKESNDETTPLDDWIQKAVNIEHALTFKVMPLAVGSQRPLEVVFVKNPECVGVQVVKELVGLAELCCEQGCDSCSDMLLVTPLKLTPTGAKTISSTNRKRSNRISVLTIAELMFDVTKVNLVNPQRKMTEKEVAAMCDRYKLTNPKLQLPKMIAETDPVAKRCGWVPGDVVQVESPGFFMRGFRVVV